jgi:RNA polymerase sigma factor (sigma-70 family)
MDAALARTLDPHEQDRRIAVTVARERGRLLRYIRRRIADASEAEDILQDAFYELVAAYRLSQPIEQAQAWLRRVVRNRIIDRFRRQQLRQAGEPRAAAQDSDAPGSVWELLPAPHADPHSAALRAALLAEIERALAALPPEQREVFIAHELEGISFRELATRTGVGVNTLLARKHYATRALRRRLEAAWQDWLQN